VPYPSAVSIAAARCVTFGCGLLAFVLRVGYYVQLPRIGPHVGAVPAEFVVYPIMLVVLGLPFGLFVLLIGVGRRRPTSFTRRKGRLLVAGSPLLGGTQSIFWMMAPASVVQVDMHVSWGNVAEIASVWAVAIAFLFLSRPTLSLDAQGLTLKRVRTVRLSWDDLAPGGPPPPTGRNPHYLTLFLNRPPEEGQRVPSETLPVGWLHIDPTFLADTIHDYVDHPEARAAIGSAGSPALAATV
jgi:hypothetical protein